MSCLLESWYTWILDLGSPGKLDLGSLGGRAQDLHQGPRSQPPSNSQHSTTTSAQTQPTHNAAPTTAPHIAPHTLRYQHHAACPSRPRARPEPVARRPFLCPPPSLTYSVPRVARGSRISPRGTRPPPHSNHVVLRPGDAIYLAANEPHAYIAGECVERMGRKNFDLAFAFLWDARGREARGFECFQCLFFR